MRVVVTGATGFIGTALVPELNAAGHEVVVLSRDPDRSRRSLPLVRSHHAWQPLEELAPREALEGSDAIVHLAGEPVFGRWTARHKRSIRESRVLGTRHLVDALEGLDHRPRQLVAASAIGFYGERGDERLMETSGPGEDFLATVAVEWEGEEARAAESGLRVAHLRLGIVLAPDGGALEQMLLPFRLGLGGPLGHGNQFWSWIHRADLLRMILAALDAGWQGAFNATAPHPVRQADFARALGRELGRPALLPAPAFALEALLGEFSCELLTSKRVLPEAAGAAGFRWRFGRLEPALADLLG